MTVAEINALLYLPPHPRERLERALRIAALSAGWRVRSKRYFRVSKTARKPETQAWRLPPQPIPLRLDFSRW